MFMIRPGSRPGAVDGETRTTTANTKLTNPAALAAFSPCRHTFSTPISAANPTIVHTFITPNAIINNINAQQHPTTPNNTQQPIVRNQRGLCAVADTGRSSSPLPPGIAQRRRAARYSAGSHDSNAGTHLVSMPWKRSVFAASERYRRCAVPRLILSGEPIRYRQYRSLRTNLDRSAPSMTAGPSGTGTLRALCGVAGPERYRVVRPISFRGTYSQS